MKRTILYLGLSAVSIAAIAGLPKWVITPTNDNLSVSLDNKVIEGRVGAHTYQWDFNGKLLNATPDSIAPYSDDVATTIKKGTDLFTGFVDENGHVTQLTGLRVAYGNPRFENGLLTAIKGEKIVYIDHDGKEIMTTDYFIGYPFHDGFASFITYDDEVKKKNPHWGYMTPDGQEVSFVMLNGNKTKEVNPQDIEFLSSIASNGKSVAVVKGKLYWFIPGENTLLPLEWGTNESAKKRQLALVDDSKEKIASPGEGPLVLSAKYGNNEMARLEFDQELIPVVFTYGGEEQRFPRITAKITDYPTTLASYGSDRYGLKYNGNEILPEQFDEVGLRYGDRAFVKLNGKWGVIEYLPDLEKSLKLNKGEDIAFRHQKFETKLRLDLPAKISAKDARVDIPESTRCLLDKTSRETKDTESGNFVTYDCTLLIPSSLPDQSTVVSYSPVSIEYDGIKLFPDSITVNAWHYKYYNVDPIDSETSISNGVATFTFDINTKQKNDEGDYPFEVRLESPDVDAHFEKLSEMRYKCVVTNLKEGNNNLNIVLTEQGCPAVTFPFELYYTKPVPKVKKKEDVVVRKKAPAVTPANNSSSFRLPV